MNFTDIPLPEAYTDSADFRFFVNWISSCLSKVQTDTENLEDLIDPERCPASLLWLLSETVGYKYNSNFSPAYNRLILLYFMSMIYNRGSRTGMTLAAETNLAQFNLRDYELEDEVYHDRLADTSVPVNSVYVCEHTDMGYIDVVYYSENIPQDACLEYVRPLGMYCFEHAGVKVDSRTKISVDARLTDANSVNMPIGPTHVGHYRRADYASLQGTTELHSGHDVLTPRKPVYYRNSEAEGQTTGMIDPGYRTLYSLQLCNNEHIVNALLPSQKDPEYSVFSIGFDPRNVNVQMPDNYLKLKDKMPFNLRYDEAAEAEMGIDVYTIDKDRTTGVMNPRPAVNPPMLTLGSAISLNESNTQYIMNDAENGIHIEDK